jgi:tetratricopeptide (TPR) repeat protein
MRELLEANLVLRAGPERFRLHDLVRLYARERARREVTDVARKAARDRVIDHYLHAANRAQQQLNSHRPRLGLDDPADDCTIPAIDDSASALAWFEAEYQNVLAAQELAERAGRDAAVWQIAWTLTPYQRWQGHHDDNVTVCRKAVQAAERSGSTALRSRNRRWLGHACAKAANFGAAHEHLGHALRLAELGGDPVDRAYARHSLALTCGWSGDDAKALEHASVALAVFEQIGNPIWEAEVLNTAGWYHGRLGQYREAFAMCERARLLNQAHAYRDGEAHALDSLGSIARLSGRHTQALSCYRNALAIRRALGDRYGEATTLAQLGEVHAALGRLDRAHRLWRRSCNLYETQGCATEARKVHGQLAGKW